MNAPQASPVANRFSTRGAIFVTEGDDLLAKMFATRFGADAVRVFPGTLESQDGEIESVRAIAITVRSQTGAADMDRFPSLEVITTGSAGYDHIDLAAAQERGIKVCNVPDYGPAVAEFNMALLLALSRKLHRAYLQTREHDFDPLELLGHNLSGRTLGVIGTGNIGAKLAHLASAFGMRVIATDPSPRAEVPAEYMALDDLLRQADMISLCCPLTDKTRHMIGFEQFKAMKRGVLLVNTSRGAVVDTQALLWALGQDIVEAVALDVLEGEALILPGEWSDTLIQDPKLTEALEIAEGLTLTCHPKVLVTPHIAYYTTDSLQAIREVTVENVAAFAAGAPQNLC